MKKVQGEIKKTTLMGEIISKHPKAAQVLAEKYGFHCMGCPASQMESLEDGVMVHGMKNKDLEKLVEELNQIK